MVILPEDFVQFSSAGALRALDGFIKRDREVETSDFYPAALQAGADKGKQYALPLECVPQMMFINKTLLQKSTSASRITIGRGMSFTACVSS